MDMFDGVGRRQDQKTGQLVNIGANSLNGREAKVLFRNDGDGTFTDVAYVNDVARIEDGRGLSVFDYDLDGNLDLLLRNYRQPTVLLRNQGGGPNHWIALKLVGTRSNRDAVGARVFVEAGGRRQMREVATGSGYLSSSSLVQHFGLGADERADAIDIHWPSGARTEIRGLAADRRYVVREGENTATVAR